jgi:hypothetical protein
MSVWAPVNDQDVLEMETGLDDKDKCREKEKGEKRKPFEMRLPKIDHAIWGGTCG